MSTSTQTQADPIEGLISMMEASKAGPSAPAKKEMTTDDFFKMLDETPLFMRDTPEDGAENPVLDGLRSLIFEGEGDEVAQNFKDHGNELYAQKSFKDAIKSYSDGLDASPKDLDLKVSLLNNRSASNLALRNYGQVLRDSALVIAVCTKEKREVPIKTLWRAGKSLIGLERWQEAGDVIKRGKERGGKEWDGLEEEVARGVKREVERSERIRREKLSAVSLKGAIESRGVIIVNTPSPPDNPHPAAFDPDALPSPLPLSDPTWTPPPISTPLIFPTFLLYPAHAQSDLITHFQEETSLDQQLAVMFPSSSEGGQPGFPEWDTRREYYTSNLVAYVETRARRLLKVGKDLSLREVLAKAVKKPESNELKDGVILKDGLLSFIVLPKGKAEQEWIADFKRQRDGK